MKYHRLSRFKIKRIILCFAEDITASSASKILHINRNTTNAYYNEIREKILQYSLKKQAKELGEFELDESCFGVRRVRGKKRVDSRQNAGFWAAKKKWESICDGCSELFERRADAHCSRENPGKINSSHGRLKNLRWPYFERLQPLPSIP